MLITPTTKQERILSLDFLRGIAILGILVLNIEDFAYKQFWVPWKFGIESTIDTTVRFWVYFLGNTKFMAMFELLFGVGFYIFLERLEKKQLGLKAMDIYARRLLWLFVFGVIHYYFIWGGDVLVHYSLCGLLLFPFRSIRSRNLLLIICLLAGLLFFRSYQQTERRKGWQKEYTEAIKIPEKDRTEADQKKIDKWENKTKKRTPYTGEVKNLTPSYLKGLQKRFKEGKPHQGTFYSPGLVFGTLIMMLLGILLYRSGVFKDYTVWKHYWFISIGILCFGLLLAGFRSYQWTYEYFKLIMNPFRAWLYLESRTVLGLGYILFFNGVCQKYLKRVRFKMISNVGKMALSNYILQSVLLGFIFYGYGFNKFNQFSRSELLVIVFVIWIIQIVLSGLWLKKYERGPLESLWRRLTYNSFNKEVV